MKNTYRETLLMTRKEFDKLEANPNIYAEDQGLTIYPSDDAYFDWVKVTIEITAHK